MLQRKKKEQLECSHRFCSQEDFTFMGAMLLQSKNTVVQNKSTVVSFMSIRNIKARRKIKME